NVSLSASPGPAAAHLDRSNPMVKYFTDGLPAVCYTRLRRKSASSGTGHKDATARICRAHRRRSRLAAGGTGAAGRAGAARRRADGLRGGRPGGAVATIPRFHRLTKKLAGAGASDSCRGMIRGGFLDPGTRADLIALVRDGKAETRLTRRANALLLLD